MDGAALRRAQIDRAVTALRSGGLAVIPTDTVYGLAAMPGAPGAVEAVFAAKGRPEDKPLPVLGAGLDQLGSVAVLHAAARRLAEAFWPGPLTLVLPRAPGFDHDIGGQPGGPVGIRMPACDVALELLRSTGPLAVTSANLSGRPPCQTAEEARAELGRAVDVVVDAGRRAGAVSTVVSLVGVPAVLRAGALSEAEVLQAVGAP